MHDASGMPQQLEMLTTAQACQVLGIERTTLTRWVAAGRIKPAHKLPSRNGAFLFHRDDVKALVAERTEAATA